MNVVKGTLLVLGTLVFVWFIIGLIGGSWIVGLAVALGVALCVSLERTKKKVGEPEPPMVAQPTTAVADPAEAMRKLAAMRHEGYVTGDEYEQKKTEILARL
jgi:uncharacterized protein (DUF697 family)